MHLSDQLVLAIYRKLSKTFTVPSPLVLVVSPMPHTPPLGVGSHRYREQEVGKDPLPLF
jgi:hypothetical protein